MDNFNAPQWADFNASDMSDIEDYFNIEHSNLEGRNSSGTPYASLPSTPISKASGSCYNTPKSKIPQSPLVTASATLDSPREGVLTRSARKLKVQTTTYEITGITPAYFMMKYGDPKLSKASTPRVAFKNKEISPVENKLEISSVENKEDSVTLECPSKPEAAEPKLDISQENLEEENPSHNTTLVAVPEKNVSQESSIDEEKQKCDSKTRNDEKIGSKTEIEAEPEAKSTVECPSSPKKVDETPLEPLLTLEVAKDEKVDLEKPLEVQNPSKRIVADGKKIVRAKPTVLTTRARRQSISKYRRTSNKYVSLAEAVSKFQHGTPERFRSKSGKTAVAGPLQKVRQTTSKLTCATSPLLRCKYRTRNAAIPNREEREKMEIEEIRKNRIKPNPIKPSVMNPPPFLKKTVKKTTVEPKREMLKPKINVPLKKVDEKATNIPNSLPSSSKTIEQKKLKPIVADATNSKKLTAMNPPKSTIALKNALSSRRTMLNGPKKMTNIDGQNAIQEVSLRRRTAIAETSGLSKQSTKIDAKQATSDLLAQKPINWTLKTIDKSMNKIETLGNKKNASILSTSTIPETARKHTPCKKIVQTVVSTEEGPTLKDVEILHFGIPVATEHKKITRVVPFSFDTRSKESKTKKEQLKTNQQTEPKKKTFQARPVPSFIAKPSTTVKTPSKPLVTHCPFSFQERNEQVLKKKKELFDQMIEREKQARIFHAKPAPNFKPVFVRGASAENLRPHTENSTKITHSARLRGLSQSSINDNRENVAPNVPLANRQIPKLKNPLTTQNFKIKNVLK